MYGLARVIVSIVGRLVATFFVSMSAMLTFQAVLMPTLVSLVPSTTTSPATDLRR